MVGDSVNNFQLKDNNGNKFDLFASLDKKVLLVFYPRDNSPVCSRQLNDYTKNKNEFYRNDIKIYGINSEDQQHHQSFCANIGIDFPLLIDEDKKITKKFNALGFAGSTKRKLVLIGTDKKILFEKTVFPLFYLNSEQILKTLRDNNVIL